ncbi:MAG: hypothetical protein A2Y07_10935 [Planctomycetes bacterium GWF2_50_10]|nr:MAG: hypothetical protein A2Y07_10935 [Planctomycetes bacterium GWF2_50_10]
MALNHNNGRNFFKNVHLAAGRLVLIYAVVAGVYILASDKFLHMFIQEPDSITWLQSVKGLVFVAVTSLLLYVLVSSYLMRLKKAHDDLAQSENTFATAFRRSPESISISTVDSGVYIDVNEGFTTFTGYSREEAVGHDVLSMGIWCNPEDRAKMLAGLEANEQVVGMETRFCAKDGTVKDAVISAALIYVGGEKCMITIVKDITQAKAARVERERINRELANANKELESIIYVASHDLRSALVNIQGFSRELNMTCDRLRQVLSDPQIPAAVRSELHNMIDTDIPETLNFILSSTGKIDMLLTGLLKISRLSRQQIDIRALNMDKIVGEIIRSMQFGISQSGAKVTAEHLDNCMGDATMVSQVFENLLSNALKYLDPGRPGRIHISSKRSDSMVEYCVEDNGIGIARQFQGKIFEIFHRLNPDQSAGDGLGLNIIKQIVERHNGRVRVESEQGKGSRFFVSFPAAEQGQ